VIDNDGDLKGGRPYRTLINLTKVVMISILEAGGEATEGIAALSGIAQSFITLENLLTSPFKECSISFKILLSSSVTIGSMSAIDKLLPANKPLVLSSIGRDILKALGSATATQIRHRIAFWNKSEACSKKLDFQ
jgi:hypothetical protein